MRDPNGEAFREEALELLGDLERSTLELELRPHDRELIGQIFRQMHTIKGSGAMFGFDQVAAFTHHLETAYDWLREGRIAVSAELIGLTLRARDHLLGLLQAPDEGAYEGTTEGEAILAGFRTLMGGATPAAARETATAPAGRPDSARRSHLIHFEPAPGVFVNGTNLPALFDDLRGFGRCAVFAHDANVPSLEALDPDVCYLYWDIVLTGAVSTEAIRDTFLFVEDDAVLLVEPLAVDVRGAVEAASLAGLPAPYRGLDLELVAATLREHWAPEAPGPLDTAADSAPAAAVPGPADVAAQAATPSEQLPQHEAAGSIRVSAGKVDGLMNLVGELVTLDARLAQLATQLEDPDLVFVSEEVERISQLLRDSALAMRMLPLSTSFGRFRRLVRDLSKDLDKQVEFVTEGGETELDKTVIEHLNDVFVHLIRNAIDHGIEDAATRQAAGKPAAGTIRLTATHSGTSVHIRVEDDGAGLDSRRILATAVERGVIAAGTELTEKETYALIMRPGFSTAQRITGISGRGVGMDVVQRTMSALRGSIDIGSERGRGTRFTLKLPLTLAIIDGLLVQAAGQHFVLPQSNLVECVEVLRSEREGGTHRRSCAAVRGELIPYIGLREEFGLTGGTPEIVQAIIAETELGKVAVVVDNVVGDYQTVIKPLGALCRKAESISGATILGDGSIALIVDVEKLATGALRQYGRKLRMAS
jgi:two-component system, chemotaxis family, sensor kinase CheA